MDTEEKPREKLLYRCLAVTILCLYGLCLFTCFDSVGSLQEVLMKSLNISTYEFSYFYSVGFYPNIVLGFCGGYLIDRLFGIRMASILYMVIAAIGHFIFSFGIFFGIYWLTLFGRFIFGAGMEMSVMCLHCYAFIWFKGKELSTAICLIVSVARVGSSLAYSICTPLYNYLSQYLQGSETVGATLLIMGTFTIIAIGDGIIMKVMDSKMSLAPESNGKTHNNKIQLKDILGFPTAFWMLVIIQTALSTIYIFQHFSQSFFVNHFQMAVESANKVTSFFVILSAVVGPFTGLMVDKLGRIVYFYYLGMAMGLTGHLILTFTNLTPYVGMIFLALGFIILTSAVAPLIAFIIPKHQLGTAYGVFTSMTSATYSINLLVAGILVDKYSFTGFETYELAWMLVGIMGASIIFVHDRAKKTDINISATQRDLKLKQNTNDETKVPLRA